MAERDYASAPVSETLGLEDIIKGLASDLEALRAKEISVQDAHARAAVAKQMFNGVRLYLQAMQMLEARAKQATAIEQGVTKGDSDRLEGTA